MKRITSIGLRTLGHLLLAPLVARPGVFQTGFPLQYAAQILQEFLAPILPLILPIGAWITYRCWCRNHRPGFSLYS